MRLLTAWVLVLVAAGCGRPHIRLANNSDLPLEDVLVQFPSGTERYGTIPPGGRTEYRAVEQAYRYAYVEAMVGGESAVIQPIDYVGESLLWGGRYTYALTVNPRATSTRNRLHLTLVRD